MSFNDRFQSLFGGENADIATVVVTPEAYVEQQQDNLIAEAEKTAEEALVVVTETQNDMEVLEERVETLEEKIDGVESMLNGSRAWNPELAQSLYADARKLDVRTFGEANAISVKGAEAFSDKDAAALELVSGLESLKEKAGKMWEGVKQFFINLYNSIKNFFVGLFNRFRGIEGKGQALVTRLNGAADDKIKKEITLGGWNAFVDAEKTKGKDTAASRASIDAVSRLGIGLKGKYEGMVEVARASFNALAAAGASKKSTASTDNNETISFVEGGIEFTVTMPLASPKDKAAALAATKISYKVAGDSVKTSGTITTGASKSDLVSIAQAVVKGAKDAQVNAFKESELKTARDKAIAEVEVAARGTGAEKADTKKEVAGIRNAHNAGLRAAMVISRYTGDLLKAQLGYVGAHL